MDKLEHLTLPEFKTDLERKKGGGGGGYTLPKGRSKRDYSRAQIKKAREISHNFSKLKEQYKGRLDPHLIFEINVNDKIDTATFEKELLKMGLDVLSVAEDKKGYWIVFASDEQLEEFRARLDSHGKDGEDGATKYDFFNAISEIEDIPVEKKIAPSFLLRKFPGAVLLFQTAIQKGAQTSLRISFFSPPTIQNQLIKIFGKRRKKKMPKKKDL